MCVLFGQHFRGLGAGVLGAVNFYLWWYVYMADTKEDFNYSIYGNKETSFQHVEQLPPDLKNRILTILKNMEFTDKEKDNIVNKYNDLFSKYHSVTLNPADLQRFVDEEWKSKYPVSSRINSSPKVPVQGGRTLRRRRSSRRSLRRQRIRRTRRRV
jgi:hypothetical protein